jgi:XTP/dITP diphosphohydrolase
VKTLVIATRNKGKVAEIERILKFDRLNQAAITVKSVAEFDLADVEETGDTFEANALLKALTVSRATGLPALADDSGLAVEALGGAPGIFSARYSGVHGDDAANIEKLLSELSDLSDSGLERSARFIAVIAVAKPDGSHIMARGELLGSIATSKRGINGFGYDPIFIPTGSSRTLGEYQPEEKDAISHRARALAEIAPKVAPFLNS